MNTKIIKLDLNRILYDKIIAKQGDTKSRFLLFQLLDGSIPFYLTNRSVRAYMVKPDGKEIFNDLIINNYSLGYCTLELTNQVLAVPGTVKIELMVTEEDRKLTSSVFELEVIKSINSEKSIISTNEFTALLNGLSSLSEYDNYKNEIAAARDGEVNLLTKVKKIDEQLDNKVHKIHNTESIFASSSGLFVNENASIKNSILENKFDKNTVTMGKIQNGDGSIVNSSSHVIGQMTNAENVKTVIIKNTKAIGLRLGEYDCNGDFILRTSKNTNELVVNLNENTKYIIFGCNKEGLDTVRMYFIYKNTEYVENGKTFININENVSSNKSINIEQYYFIDEKVKTKYWITYVPRYDEKGNISELKLGFANNMINGDIFPETTRSFANRNNATVCINAGVSWASYRGDVYYNKDGQKCNKMHGLRVYDHMLVSNDIESNWYKKTHWALGITDDGLLVSFATIGENGDTTMSYEESQQLGCKFVTSAFTPIMLNGVSQKEVLEYKNQWINEDGSNVYYQRQIIGQNSQTKDIFFLTSNGKGTGTNSDGLIIDGGIPLDNCIDILKNFGCDFAYQLDEGGSTSLIYKGIQINDKSDDGGKTERLLSDFLYVGTNPINDRDKDIRDIRKELSDLKNKMGNFNKLFLESESDNTREIQRWVNGSLKHSLNLKNGALQYYDSPNKKTIFNIDTSGLISTMLGVLGFFPKELAAITSEYFPNYSTCFVYPPNVNNAPFTVNAFVIHLLWGSGGGQMQIALPYTSSVGGDLYPKWRTKTSGQWNSWNKFSS